MTEQRPSKEKREPLQERGSARPNPAKESGGSTADVPEDTREAAAAKEPLSSGVPEQGSEQASDATKASESMPHIFKVRGSSHAPFADRNPLADSRLWLTAPVPEKGGKPGSPGDAAKALGGGSAAGQASGAQTDAATVPAAGTAPATGKPETTQKAKSGARAGAPQPDSGRSLPEEPIAERPPPNPEPYTAPSQAEIDDAATEHPRRAFEATEEAAQQAEMEPEPAPVHPHPPFPYRHPMSIVMVSPELEYVAKVGGLADVVFGLSRELEIRGNHVEIILPKYDCMRYDHIWGLQPTYPDLWVPWFSGSIHCTVFFGFVHHRKCFFIEPHSNDNFFNRNTFYGCQDDVLRFAFFCRAALEFMYKAGKHPDIIHCHDWQTGLVPPLHYEMYAPHMGMTHSRICYTIHNFLHQGIAGAEVLYATGLNRPAYFYSYDRLRDNGNPHVLNLMKGGIVYSNFITTVSPRHAWEAKDSDQGHGMGQTLQRHHQKFGGVLNGVDYDIWNPEIDRYIPHQYGLNTIDRKYLNKRALRDRLILADNAKPIIAYIGRLDAQKGLDLIRHALFYAIHNNAQFVLLGTSPEDSINRYFWDLKGHINENPDSHIEIGFSAELAHLIYAGADMIIVPSRFEPCGLTQLIAMRYGTVPIVRSIGGLADTVFDKDYSHKPLHERNGYVFQNDDYPGIESAVSRAIACYYSYPAHFRHLMLNGMRSDYSWNRPGNDYLNIYDYIKE